MKNRKKESMILRILSTLWVIGFILVMWAGMSQKVEAFENCKLSKDQEAVMRFSYEYGKPYDFGYTMTAIAMQESRLGKWRLNLSDPSAGVYHTTLDKGLKKLGWSNNGFNRNRVAQMMIDDIYFAAGLSLDTLLWWNNYHDGDWSSVVSSYNGGHRGNPEYVEIIANNIKIIKKCGWLKEPSMLVYSD